MRFVGLDKIITWKWELMLYHLELYDTAAYVQRGVPSPFLWSFSNQYTRGKITDNNTYEPNTIDAMMGCAPLLKQMQLIDPSVTLPLEFTPTP
jgi:lysozyme family protein